MLWLRGTKATYMSKKFLLLLVLAEQNPYINWVKVVMNNLHSRLRDISGPSKKVKDGGPTEFGLAQVLDIVFWRWFLMDEV